MDSSNIQGQKRLIKFNNNDSLNPNFQKLFLNIKKKFGMVTCIGSQDFYLYTRQMMLHLSLQQAIDLDINKLQVYGSRPKVRFLQQQKSKQKLKSPPKMKKYNSNSDDLDTSFAKNSVQYINQLIKTEINNVNSEYQLSHIEFQKSVQNQIFSSVQNQSQTQRKRSNSIQKNLFNFSKYIEEFNVYSQTQIGTTKQKNPIQWVYNQIGEITPQILKLGYLLSSCLIFEVPLSSKNSQSAKKLQKQLHIKRIRVTYDQVLKELQNFQQNQKNAMPEIIIIASIHQNQNQEKQKDQFNIIFQKYFGKKQPQSVNSPFYQYQLTTPSKTHLPPTPKRFPLSLKQDFSKKVRLQFRIVSENLSKSGVLREDYSRMRQITMQGKSIFNQIFPKQIQGNLIQPICYIQLIKNLLQTKFVQNLIMILYQEWEKVYSKFLQQNIEQTIQDYKDKICQLTLGKSIVSNAKLQQAHQIAKRQTLKNLSQKKIGGSKALIKSINSVKSGLLNNNPSPKIIHNRKISISRKLQQSKFSMNNHYEEEQDDLIYVVESKLNILKQQMQEKNKINSLNWGQKFLENQYKIIQKKILLNEIKSFGTFKQELALFRQFFMKKLQTNCAYEPELLIQYQNFIFSKIFQGIDSIVQKQKEETNSKSKKLQKRNEDLQLQLKQFKKKQVNKEKTANENSQQLIRKNQELNHVIQKLQNELEQQERKYQVESNNLESQILKLQQKNYLMENQKKQAINAKNQQMEQIKLHLQSMGFQLQKEQLLHQQTHQNYEQIIKVMKQGENSLNIKIDKLKQQTVQKQHKLKESCSKQHHEAELSKIQLEKQIKNLQNQIQCKNIENEKLNDQIRKLKQLHQFQIKKLKEDIIQFQQQNKNLEQKNIEVQFQLQKIKTIQINTHKIIEQKQKINLKNKESEQKLALLQQKQKFIQQELQKYKQKTTQVSQKYHETLIEVQKWKQACQNKKKLYDKQIQSDPDFRIQNLKLAQKMVQSLQEEYQNKKKQLAKYKIILKSPIYSHLK